MLLMCGYEDVGSTVTEVLRRYTWALQPYGGRVILAGVNPRMRGHFQRIEMLDLIGEENDLLSTNTIGEAGSAALRAARGLLAESSTEIDKSMQ